MKKIILGTLTIHDLTAPCSYAVESPISGLEFPELRTTSQERAGSDGIYITQQFTGERRIALKGHLAGASASDYQTLRQNFLAALAPVKVDGVLSEKLLRFTTNDSRTFRVSGQVVKAEMSIEELTFGKFYIDFLATDAVITEDAASTYTISPYVGGGFTLPVVLPITFGEGSGGSAVVPNGGNASTYPIITLNGPLTNPRIENRTSGDFLAITHTIAIGESITVDMLNRTIIQGGITNRISTKSADSTFWPLIVGDNTIVLTTSVSGESGTAVIEYRDAYTGV